MSKKLTTRLSLVLIAIIFVLAFGLVLANTPAEGTAFASDSVGPVTIYNNVDSYGLSIKNVLGGAFGNAYGSWNNDYFKYMRYDTAYRDASGAMTAELYAGDDMIGSTYDGTHFDAIPGHDKDDLLPVGTYTVHLLWAAAGTYEEGEGNFDFEISRKDVSVDISTTTIKYSGEMPEASELTSYDDADLVWYYGDGELFNTKLALGEYSIWAEIVGDAASNFNLTVTYNYGDEITEDDKLAISLVPVELTIDYSTTNIPASWWNKTFDEGGNGVTWESYTQYAYSGEFTYNDEDKSYFYPFIVNPSEYHYAFTNYYDVQLPYGVPDVKGVRFYCVADPADGIESAIDVNDDSTPAGEYYFKAFLVNDSEPKLLENYTISNVTHRYVVNPYSYSDSGLSLCNYGGSLYTSLRYRGTDYTPDFYVNVEDEMMVEYEVQNLLNYFDFKVLGFTNLPSTSESDSFVAYPMVDVGAPADDDYKYGYAIIGFVDKDENPDNNGGLDPRNYALKMTAHVTVSRRPINLNWTSYDSFELTYNGEAQVLDVLSHATYQKGSGVFGFESTYFDESDYDLPDLSTLLDIGATYESDLSGEYSVPTDEVITHYSGSMFYTAVFLITWGDDGAFNEAHYLLADTTDGTWATHEYSIAKKTIIPSVSIPDFQFGSFNDATEVLNAATITYGFYDCDSALEVSLQATVRGQLVIGGLSGDQFVISDEDWGEHFAPGYASGYHWWLDLAVMSQPSEDYYVTSVSSDFEVTKAHIYASVDTAMPGSAEKYVYDNNSHYPTLRLDLFAEAGEFGSVQLASGITYASSGSYSSADPVLTYLLKWNGVDAYPVMEWDEDYASNPSGCIDADVYRFTLTDISDSYTLASGLSYADVFDVAWPDSYQSYANVSFEVVKRPVQVETISLANSVYGSSLPEPSATFKAADIIMGDNVGGDADATKWFIIQDEDVTTLNNAKLAANDSKWVLWDEYHYPEDVEHYFVRILYTWDNYYQAAIGTAGDADRVEEYVYAEFDILKKELVFGENLSLPSNMDYKGTGFDLSLNYSVANGYLTPNDIREDLILSGNLEIDAGDYTLTVSGIKENTVAYKNYKLPENVEDRSWDYTINKRPIYATIDDQTSTYGDSVVTSGFTVKLTNSSSYATGDSFADVFTISHSITSTMNAATYEGALTNGKNNANYEYHVTNGNYILNKRDATLSIEAKTITFGDDVADINSVKQTGILDGDTNGIKLFVTTKGGDESASFTVIKSYTHAGVYDIVAYLDNANYNCDEVRADYTINRKEVQVTVVAPEDLVYSNSDKTVTATYEDVNGITQNASVLYSGDRKTVAGGGFTASITIADTDYKIVANTGYTLGDGAYKETGTTSTYVITARPLTIKAKDLAYDDASVTVETVRAAFAVVNPDGYTGFAPGEDKNVLTGDFEFDFVENFVYTTGAGKGTYKYSVSGKSNSNYNISYENGVISIGTKALTITFESLTHVYDKENWRPVYSSNSGLLSGDTWGEAVYLVWDEEADAINYSADAYVRHFHLEGSKADSYSYEDAVSFTITKRPITISLPGNATNHFVYGNADNTFLPGYLSVTAGSLAGDDNCNNVASYSFNLSHTSPANNNPYVITVSGINNNYNVTATTANYWIDPRPVNVVWGNTALTYTGSTQFPTHSLNQDDIVNGDTVVITNTSGSQTNYSAEPYQASITGINNNNYVLANATTTFTIAKADSVITTVPVKVTGLVYSGDPQEIVTAGVAAGGTIWYSTTNWENSWSTDLPTKTNAGNNYHVWYKVVGDSNHNDISETEISGISIAKATIEDVALTQTGKADFIYNGNKQKPTVSGDATTKKAADVAVFHYNYRDRAKDDPSWSTEVPTEYKNVGDANVLYYYVSVEGGNYWESAVDSITIEIAQRALSLNWVLDENGSFQMNGFSEGTFKTFMDFVYNGAKQHPNAELVNKVAGDDVAIVFGEGIANAITNGGFYRYEISSTKGLSGTTKGNYKWADNAELKVFYFIAPKEITVTAEGKTSVYGNALEELTATVTDKDGAYVLPDAAADVYTLSKAEGTNAGDYAITVNVVNNGNYTVTPVNAKYTITQRPILYSIDSQTSVYGEEIKECAAELVNGVEGKLDIVGDDQPIFTLTAYEKILDNVKLSNTSPVGDYPVTGKDEDPNYFISFYQGSYQITKKAITVTYTGEHKEITFADAQAFYELGEEMEENGWYLTVPTVAGEDPFDVIEVYVDFTEEAAAAIDVFDTPLVGKYNLIVSGISNNYDVTVNLGNDAYLQVNKATLTITADEGQSKIFGNEDPTFTFTATLDAYEWDEDTKDGFIKSVEELSEEEIAFILTGALSREEGETARAYAITRGDLAFVTEDSIALPEDAFEDWIEDEEEAAAYIAEIEYIYKSLVNNFVIEFVSADFTIENADMSIEIAQSGSLTYNGQDQTAEVEKDVEVQSIGNVNPSATIAYKAKGATGDYGAMPVFKNAGTYTVLYKVTAANHNDLLGEFDVTIAPKAITVSADRKTSVFGDALVALTATVTDKDGAYVLPDAAADVYTLSKAEGVTAGEYVITVNVVNNGNYTVTPVAGAYAITKATPAINTDGITKSYFYTGENITLAGVATTPEGTPTYDLTTFKEVGEYTVTISVAETANYVANSTTITVKINEAEVTPEVDETTGATKAETYKDIKEEEVKESGVSIKEAIESVTSLIDNGTATIANLELNIGEAEVDEEGNKTYKTTITFDTEALKQLAANADVTIKFEKVEAADIDVTEKPELKNAQLVLEISLAGATFDNGMATITTEFVNQAPKGKKAVVFYIAADGSKTDMKACFKDGKVTFTTTHFSTYAVEYVADESGLGGGAIAGIVIGCIAGVALACGAWFFLKKKKAAKNGEPEAKEEVAADNADAADEATDAEEADKEAEDATDEAEATDAEEATEDAAPEAAEEPSEEEEKKDEE